MFRFLPEQQQQHLLWRANADNDVFLRAYFEIVVRAAQIFLSQTKCYMYVLYYSNCYKSDFHSKNMLVRSMPITLS